MAERTIDADPYPWPFDGDLAPANTALIVIDMQTDFCGPGGYVDRMGYDLSLTRAPVEPIRRGARAPGASAPSLPRARAEPIRRVLGAMRAQGYHVLHTREGHRPDLADLPENK